MLFSWLQQRRRDRLRAAPFPEAWLEILQRNVRHYGFLSEYEQHALRSDLRILIAEKFWEGCGGQTITDEVRVTIAAQACLLTLNLKHDFYPNVQSILVYPSGYRAPRRQVDALGIVTEGKDHRLGEAWRIGPVVLSWADVQAGGTNPRDGQNVVLHEFAHKLDMMDGTADGYPRLHEDEDYPRWFEAMSAEYAELVRRSERGQASVLDHYGAENAVELFAVATEAFFEKPLPLRRRHARLYAVLQEYYRQDPADRLEALGYREE